MTLIAGGEQALASGGALGPLFRMSPLSVVGTGRGWQSVEQLIVQPARLRERVAATRRLLALGSGLEVDAIAQRTAASLTVLGLVARIVSPLMGAGLLTSVLPVLSPGAWLIGPSRPGSVAVAGHSYAGLMCAGAEDLADALTERCMEPVVRPLLDMVADSFGVSGKVLRGNVASAVAGAAGLCIRARPDLSAQAGALVGALLSDGLLEGTGSWGRPDPTHPEWSFVRRSCCLLYRLPGAEPCGDCIFLRLRQRGGRGPEDRSSDGDGAPS